MTKFTVVIPARYASTRLSGKALREIDGIAMVVRVYQQAQKSQAQRIIIATDNQNIADVAHKYGAETCMTASTHSSGTARIAECVNKLKFNQQEIIVNVQGDEPFIPPQIINQLAHSLNTNSSANIATLATPLVNLAELHNPNCVKVLRDVNNYALYFSRWPLAWSMENPIALRHIGAYAYRCNFLARFSQLASCALEQSENLEQLRALWHGAKILVTDAATVPPHGIDTAEDLKRANHYLSTKCAK